MFFSKNGLSILMFGDIITFKWWPFLTVHSENLQNSFPTLVHLLLVYLRLLKGRARGYKEVTGFNFRNAINDYCRSRYPHIKYGIVVFGNIDESVVSRLSAFMNGGTFKDCDMFIIACSDVNKELALLDLLEKENVLNYVTLS